MLIKILKLKYTLIMCVAIIALTGLTSYAQDGKPTREGGWAEVPSPPAPQVSTSQIETIQDLVIPADGNEPSRIEDASGKIAIEGKIIQLERKVDQLIYLNAILLLFIVVTAGSFAIVKIRKKLL